jgi:hypothetical protein
MLQPSIQSITDQHSLLLSSSTGYALRRSCDLPSWYPGAYPAYHVSHVYQAWVRLRLSAGGHLSASEEFRASEPTTFLLVKLLSIFSLLWITTFISDLPQLAIPCFALAPHRLMLAVIPSPLGFGTTFAGVATLSQAHLIQPGRALGGRTPGKSLLSRVLTATHATCRVAPKSSTPRMRGVGSAGLFFLARLRSVSALTGMANCSVSREPACPLRTTAMQSSSVPKRVVCRAETGRSGKRSANVCRWQS